MIDHNQRPPNPFEESIKTCMESDPTVFGGISNADDIERAAFDVLDSTDEGQELMQRIVDARNKNQEDKEAVHERNKMYRTIAVEISLITGIEIEEADHEAQRETYTSQLSGLLSRIGPEDTDEDIMLKLGIIRPVEGNRGNVFTFPSRIFPPYIKEQWTTYTGMIDQFDDAKRRLERGVITQDDFNAVDVLRKRAHDGVSRSVGEILEFKDWGLEEYRRLVGKMRDEKYAEPKGEMVAYADLLREKAIIPEHLTKVHKHLGKHGVAGSAA